ncbi:MAG TPA: MMPL family transporter, partial [Bdellovibrio sp.]|nr:MMPL family transporter [Bdellovibrio sp.]
MKKNTKWTSLAISSLVLVFTLTGLSFLALPHLQTQYSLKQFLPKQNLLLQEDEKTRETFQLSEAQPFVVTMQVSDSDWFQEKRMQSLSFLTESLGQLEHVRSALSLANLQSALNTENGLSVGPFLKSLPIEKWRAESLTNPLISPSLISADGRTASVIVNIPSLSTKDVSLLRQQVESKAKEIIHFAEIKIGGTPAVQSDVGHLLQTEIRNFVVLGFLACFVVLGLIFANVSPLIASFIVIFCANIWVLAVMALTGTSFSILSSTIPILTTVDVVSLCLHTLLRFSEEKKNHPEMARFDLVARTVKAIMKANLIASTTTMIGFLSLLTTNVPLIRDYGWTAAVSIVLGFIVTTLLLPALLLFLPEPKARTWAWRKARWGLYLFRRSGAWTLIIVVISLSLAVRGKSLSWSAKLFDDLPANHQVRLSTETIDKKLGGMIPVDIEISGQKEIWNDPALVHQLEVLLKDIRATHGVGSAVGLTDLIAAANIHPASRRPASRSSLAEIFFLYSLSNESPLKNFLNADSSKTRLAVRTQDLP